MELKPYDTIIMACPRFQVMRSRIGYRSSALKASVDATSVAKAKVQGIAPIECRRLSGFRLGGSWRFDSGQAGCRPGSTLEAEAARP